MLTLLLGKFRVCFKQSICFTLRDRSVIFFFFGLFFCSGCAALSGSNLPLSDIEEKNATEVFREIIGRQSGCPDRLDADISLSYSRFMFSGIVTGYIQTLAPAYLRVEGVNPLGLTEFIFGTDGNSFTLLNVRNKMGYLGEVDAHGLQQYLPGGIDFTSIYSWLVGRLSDKPFQIVSFKRGRDSQEYWLTISYDNGRQLEELLLSVPQRRILQRNLLTESGQSSIRFSYDYDLIPTDKRPADAEKLQKCSIPAKITINGNGRGELTLNYNKEYPDPAFGPGDFSIDIPIGFTEELVK